jgi:hypothetical protein
MPSEKVADPAADMVGLEQEHLDWESDLLAQISDLDDKEHLDELASTNTNLREALRNLESGVDAQFDAVEQ